MKIRKIVKLELKYLDIVKGICLEGWEKIQNINDFLQSQKNFLLKNFDEIILIDIFSSLSNRKDIIQILKSDLINLSMPNPFTIGGGIKSFKDVENLFNSGADKILINSIVHKKTNIIEKIAKIYGSQSVVLNIELKRYSGKYLVMYESGREISKHSPNELIKICIDQGIGEIIVTSIDSDGMFQGFDLDIFNHLDLYDVPIIISGGISSHKEAMSLNKKYPISGYTRSSSIFKELKLLNK